MSSASYRRVAIQTVSGPVLVRIKEKRAIPAWPLARSLRMALLIAGIAGIGYYSYNVAGEYIYQSYQNWAFDQQIAGRRAVTFEDYVRERVLLRPRPAEAGRAANPPSPADPLPARPPSGSLLGRLEIPRLNLSAMVREGVDAGTLSRAVGHVPSTSLPGHRGNFAIAAHRDTLFRALRDIQQGDVVTFQSTSAQYSYEVFHTRIVKPSEVSVLRADGGLPPGESLQNASFRTQSAGSSPPGMLTMITCYPFYYVGSAPERFIVQARLISAERTPGQQPPVSVQRAANPRSRPAVRPRATRRARYTKYHQQRGFPVVFKQLGRHF